jgi:hypothetical protein
MTFNEANTVEQMVLDTPAGCVVILSPFSAMTKAYCLLMPRKGTKNLYETNDLAEFGRGASLRSA